MMDQRVNLKKYLRIVQYEREFDFIILLQVTAAFVLLLFLYVFYQYLSTKGLRADLASLQAQQKQIQTLADSLKERTKFLKSDNQLVQEVNMLKSKIAAKKELVNIYSTSKASNFIGFSNYLQAFSNSANKSVWLEEFQIDRGGSSVYLNGKALMSASVIRYVHDLRQEKIFKDKEFNALRLQNNDTDSAVRFRLSTE